MKLSEEIRTSLDRDTFSFPIDEWADKAEALEAELAQLRAENERLQEALHQEGHFILFTDSGWSIEHIVSCRPDMSSCEFHLLAQKEYGNGDVGIRGKYKVSIIDGNLVLEANDDAHIHRPAAGN